MAGLAGVQPADEDDQAAQEQEIGQEDQVVEQPVDAAQGEAVVDDAAGKTKNRGVFLVAAVEVVESGHALFEQQEPLAEPLAAGMKPAEVHPAGHRQLALVPAIPPALVRSGRQGLVGQQAHPLAEQIVDLQLHPAGPGGLETDE